MAWRKTIDNFDPLARINGILSQFPAGKMTNPLNCSIEPHFYPSTRATFTCDSRSAG
jgi:hypothetical protein